MKPLTRDAVEAELGHVDDIVVAEIISLGATAEELAEARAWTANDEPLMNDGKPQATGRVGRLIEILADLEAEDDRERSPAGT